MAYTLGEAAKAVRKSKATISGAIKSGKITASKRESDNAYQIEASELHRVYPPVQTEPQEPKPSTVELPPELHGLHATTEAAHQREVEALRDQLDRLREDRDREVRELRQDRAREVERLQVMLDRHMRLVEEAQSTIKALTDQQEAPRRGLWRRLLGK